MVKNHISSNICSAEQKNCPLGEDKPHFGTKEETRKHYEKDNASKTIAKPLTKNNLSNNNLASVKLDKELEALSKDESFFVRARVARNLNAPVPLLEELSKDEEGYVRWNVADNPNTPIHLLETLS